MINVSMLKLYYNIKNSSVIFVEVIGTNEFPSVMTQPPPSSDVIMNMRHDVIEEQYTAQSAVV